MDTQGRVPEWGFEVVVIGAGVVGLACAAALAETGHSVLILEREAKIARGITSRNSEVIHAGIYYPAGSLKADLCVQGRERLYAWCNERRVDARRIGKLIVATRSEEEIVLEDLLARGRANGVEGLEIIDEREVARLEPSIVARRALLSAESGIVDANGFCLTLLAAAESNDAVLSIERTVVAMDPRSYGWQLEVMGADRSIESIDAGLVIDAAGLESDRIAQLAGLDIDQLGWRQFPCKGDYFSLGPGKQISLNRLIYPVPEPGGLGTHATLDLAGRVRFGPDVEYVNEVRYDIDARKTHTFAKAIGRYLPNVVASDLIPDYSGIRPKLAGPGDGFRDFVIEETSKQGAAGFIACVGIESPGLTASLAIAEHVRGLVSA